MMEVIIQINSQTLGREKLARLVQYASRIVWHQMESRTSSKNTVERIKNLELMFSNFRKILRMGRFIDFGYLAFNSMYIQDPYVRFTLTMSKVAHTLYLYADHVLWLAKSGFLKTDIQYWNDNVHKFWLMSLIANLLRDLYEISHIIELHKTKFSKPSMLLHCSEVDIKNNSILSIIEHHMDVVIDTLKNVCDVFIPLTALGYVKLSPSSVGILGTISSIAALITIAKPIVRLVPS